MIRAVPLPIVDGMGIQSPSWTSPNMDSSLFLGPQLIAGHMHTHTHYTTLHTRTLNVYVCI